MRYKNALRDMLLYNEKDPNVRKEIRQKLTKISEERAYEIVSKIISEYNEEMDKYFESIGFPENYYKN